MKNKLINTNLIPFEDAVTLLNDTCSSQYKEFEYAEINLRLKNAFIPIEFSCEKTLDLDEFYNENPNASLKEYIEYKNRPRVSVAINELDKKIELDEIKRQLNEKLKMTIIAESLSLFLVKELPDNEYLKISKYLIENFENKYGYLTSHSIHLFADFLNNFGRQ